MTKTRCTSSFIWWIYVHSIVHPENSCQIGQQLKVAQRAKVYMEKWATMYEKKRDSNIFHNGFYWIWDFVTIFGNSTEYLFLNIFTEDRMSIRFGAGKLTRFKWDTGPAQPACRSRHSFSILTSLQCPTMLRKDRRYLSHNLLTVVPNLK